LQSNAKRQPHKCKGLGKIAVFPKPDKSKGNYSLKPKDTPILTKKRVLIQNKIMAGQIIKRGETWTVRIFHGRDSNGKRKFINKTVKGSKKDAQKVLNSMLRDADLGLLGNSQKQTLNEYLDVWLETIAKPRLQHRTFKDYGDLLRRYVRASLGNSNFQI
jgi:hypothetical protein